MGEVKGNSAELFVFVYGTLKPGGRFHQRYCIESDGQALKRAIPAAVKGRLYDFAQWGYPAMTAGDDWVQGYLLTFCDRAAVCSAVLQRLDALEGIVDSDVSRLDGSVLVESIPEVLVSNDSYQRCWQAVFTPSYEPLQSAWVYRMSEAQISQFGGVYLSSGSWPV